MDQLAGASAKLWLSLAKQLVNSFAPINNTLQKPMFSIESTYRAGHMGVVFLKINRLRLIYYRLVAQLLVAP